MYIGDVDAETIERAQLRDKDFERFVRRLLEAERDLRHRASVDIKGPVAPYRSDNKRDLVVEVHDPPKRARVDFTAALTWDEPGQTWYSCKGGRGWERAFYDELGKSRAKEGKVPGRRIRNRPPEPMLVHLSKGGRLVFVVAEGVIDDGDFLDAIAKVFTFWFEHSNVERPSKLREQLAFIDAHRLANFISTHHPGNLPEDLRRSLGLDVPEGFVLWDQWTDELAAGRDVPDFESDPQRDAILTAVADTSRRALRVFGPPGTGKTRVVYEGIGRIGDDARARVRYCKDLDAAHRLGRWLRDAGDVWIVLDELRTIDVEQIEPTFEANASSGARLFLIGTADEGTRTEPRRAFDLGPLGEDAIGRVIGRELGGGRTATSADQLALVRRLSENYPWYAVLLARALAADPTSIVHGDDEAPRWDFGARRVLAGSLQREYASESEWEREAELRAKCLLVAMMTRDLELPWDEIWHRHGEQLCLAIREPHAAHEVQKRELVCRQRQLLRQSGVRAQRRYVSPQNLARLILNHFFGNPDGPDLGPAVRRYAPRFRASLLVLAKAVHAKASVIDDFARGEWGELVRRAERGGIEAVAQFLGIPADERAGSYHAAVEAPGAAAEAIGHVVSRLGDRDLMVVLRVRQSLFRALRHVVHRAIPAGAFLSAEAALFRLAQVGDDHDADSAASAWKSLFLPAFHLTHQPWSLRLGRLDERLASEAAKGRALAIDALHRAVEPSEHSTIHVEEDTKDGQWPVPTTDEWGLMKNELWRRLLDACDERDERLAERARRAVVDRIRSSLGQGLLAADLHRLVAAVRSWTAEQRQALVAPVTRALRHDTGLLRKYPQIAEELRNLEVVLAPTDLRERVVALVGAGSVHAGDPIDLERERTNEEQLGTQLLRAPDDRDWVLDWLALEQPPRGPHFLRTLGAVDHDDVMRPKLVRVIRAGGSARLLSGYLLGRADADGAELVEQWMDLHADEQALVPAFIGFLVMQRPNAARLRRLQALLELGRASEDLEELAHRGWMEAIEFPEAIAFVRELVGREGLARAALPLVIRLLERETTPPVADELLELLARVLERCVEDRVVIGSQWWFEQGVFALMRAGHAARVVELVVRALDDTRRHSNAGLGHRLLESLLRQGFATDLWPHLVLAMVERRGSSLRYVLAQIDLLRYVDPEVVLSWVGSDLERAHHVAELCNPHGQTLDEVTRQLLVRFGADGMIADVLARRVRAMRGAMWGGVSAFERQQRDNAARWAEDPEPSVRAWAHRQEESLRHSVEEDDARQAYRRKYG